MSKTKVRVNKTKIPKKHKIKENKKTYKNFKQFYEEETAEDLDLKIKGLK